MGHTHSSTARAELARCIRFGDVDGMESLAIQYPHLIAAVMDRHSGASAMHLAVTSGLGAPALAKLTAFAQPRGRFQPKVEAALQASAHKAMCSFDREGRTPLMLACDIGDAECVRLLLAAGADPWQRDSCHRRTCVHFAAAKGHVDCLKLVIHHSMTVATVDRHAETSLLRHILHEPQQASSHRLLVDMPCSAGFTPAMLAALHNKPQSIHALFQAGAAFKPRSWGIYIPGDRQCRACPDGSSALHVAALFCSLAAAKAILEEYAASLGPERADVYQLRARTDGAPVDPRRLVDCEGRTPFAVARLLRHHTVLRMLNPLTPLAVALGAAPRLSTPRGHTVDSLLHIAAKAAQQVLLQQVQSLTRQMQQLRTQAQQAQQPGEQQLQQPAQHQEQQQHDCTCSSTALPHASTTGRACRCRHATCSAGQATHAKAPSRRSWPLPTLSLRRCSGVLGSSVLRESDDAPQQQQPDQQSDKCLYPQPSASVVSESTVAGGPEGDDAHDQLQGALHAARLHRLMHGVTSRCDLAALAAVAPPAFLRASLALAGRSSTAGPSRCKPASNRVEGAVSGDASNACNTSPQALSCKPASIRVEGAVSGDASNVCNTRPRALSYKPASNRGEEAASGSASNASTKVCHCKAASNASNRAEAVAVAGTSSNASNANIRGEAAVAGSPSGASNSASIHSNSDTVVPVTASRVLVGGGMYGGWIGASPGPVCGAPSDGPVGRASTTGHDRDGPGTCGTSPGAPSSEVLVTAPGRLLLRGPATGVTATAHAAEAAAPDACGSCGEAAVQVPPQEGLVSLAYRDLFAPGLQMFLDVLGGGLRPPATASAAATATASAAATATAGAAALAVTMPADADAGIGRATALGQSCRGSDSGALPSHGGHPPCMAHAPAIALSAASATATAAAASVQVAAAAEAAGVEMPTARSEGQALSAGACCAAVEAQETLEEVCGVCLDVGDFLAVKPCNHVVCAACATELIRLHSRSILPCPFCRGCVAGFCMAHSVD